MALTAIEAALFGGSGVHAVIAFTIAPAAIMVSIAPWLDEADNAIGQWTDQSAQTDGHFHDAHVIACELMDDDVPQGEEPSLPWDIIGFDVYDLGHGRGRFVLHCAEIEHVWESAWPLITTAQPKAQT